jgi:hypothetical protein
MAKFRKRPVVIDAEQWFPNKEVPGVSFEPYSVTIGGRGHGEQTFEQPPKPYVTTIHGQRAYLAPGDWVITEPDGVHHYPCKPDIFEASYEPLS